MELSDIERALPRGANAALRAAADRVGPEHRTEHAEAAEEAAARVRAAQERRERQWRTMCPLQFRDARPADLTPDQRGDLVAAWLDTPSRVLVLQSVTPGTGKTHAAYAVGNEAISEGQWVAGWAVADLLQHMRPGATDEHAETVAIECDLLILDDLGRERTNEWTTERLHRVLDARWRDDRRLVVTTNLTGEAMIDRYQAPFVDRIKDGMTFCQFTGQSRRVPAPW